MHDSTTLQPLLVLTVAQIRALLRHSAWLDGDAEIGIAFLQGDAGVGLYAWSLAAGPASVQPLFALTTDDLSDDQAAERVRRAGAPALTA